ncbi:MAG: DUF4149 domain-containing protein [Halobacteriaceae archaeon]
MSVVTAVTTLVVDAALGMWLGIMVFFSFVGAPRAFAVYEDRGGKYVNDVFPRYYQIGVGLGALAVAAALLTGVRTRFDPAIVIVVAATAVASLLAGYSVAVLIPQMDAAGEDAFEQFHRRSVLVNAAMMLAVAVALIASHLPG